VKEYVSTVIVIGESGTKPLPVTRTKLPPVPTVEDVILEEDL